MAGSMYPTRREFLKSSGLLFGAAAVQVPIRQRSTSDSDSTTDPIVGENHLTAAFENRDGKLIGLGRSADEAGVFELSVNRTGSTTFGPRHGPQPPDNFHPAGLFRIGGREFLCGGVEYVRSTIAVEDVLDDDLIEAADGEPGFLESLGPPGAYEIEQLAVRPVLYEYARRRLVEHDLTAHSYGVLGLVTAVDVDDSGAVHLLVEHSGETRESPYAAAVSVLFQEPRSRSWIEHEVIDGLGEAGPHYMGRTIDGLRVVANTAHGTRTFEGRRDSWRELESLPLGFYAQTVLPAPSGGIDLVVDRYDGNRFQRWTATPTGWRSANSDIPRTPMRLLHVSGSRGGYILVAGDDYTYVRGEESR